MTARIAIVLPRKERFARDRFGAVALVVEAYVRHSAYRDATEVLGVAVASPRDPAVFHAVSPSDRWWRRRSLGFAAGVADYLAKAPPRQIDVHNRVDVFTLLAKRFPEAAVSLWFHNDPQEMRGAKRSRQRQRILDRARFVICVSEWVRGRFIEGIASGAERVVVIPATLDTIAVAATEKDKLILYVGRIIDEKGVLPLAQALAQVLPELPDWRATIVGAGRKLRSEYVRRVAETVAPLGDRVIMPGFLDHENTMRAFAHAAIAVMPSQWPEPCGLVAREAMAAACATIGSGRGGMAESIGDAGIVVEPPDAAHLAAAMLEVARDDHRRADLQRRARQRAVEALDIRPSAARLDALRLIVDPDLK